MGEERRFNTDKEVKGFRAEEKAFYAWDAQGTGLMLHITPKKGGETGRSWRYDFRFQGKRRRLSLGRYPELSLAQARDALKAAKGLIAQGIDPCLEKQERKQEARKKAEQIAREREEAREKSENTFSKIVREWMAVRGARWRERTEEQYMSVLSCHVLPALGAMPVRSITQDDCLNILRGLEREKKYRTAGIVCSSLCAIFDFAKMRGYVGENVTEHLSELFLFPEEAKGRHYAAVTDPEGVAKILQTMAAFEKEKPLAVMRPSYVAAKLLPYLPLRLGELCGMRWEWVDFEKCLLSIPPEAKKDKKELVLPLPRQALEMLKAMERIRVNDYVFFGNERERPISGKAVTNALKAMGVDARVQSRHGWRSTFSSLCQDASAGMLSELIERCLSHSVGNTVRQAYDRRAPLLAMGKLLQWYADCLDSLRETGMMLPLDVSAIYRLEA